MDRQQLKFISALLALLMFISSASSLAMQPTASGGQSGHCQELDTDSLSCHHETSGQASCTMEDCGESCSSSRQCSSQAPIILTLLDIQNHPTAQGLAIGQITDTHLSIHPTGLYRPPRI